MHEWLEQNCASPAWVDEPGPSGAVPVPVPELVLVPVELVPVELVPAELVPVELVPVEVVPVELVPVELVGLVAPLGDEVVVLAPHPAMARVAAAVTRSLRPSSNVIQSLCMSRLPGNRLDEQPPTFPRRGSGLRVAFGWTPRG